MTVFNSTPLGYGLPNVYLEGGDLYLQPDLTDSYRFTIRDTGEVVTSLLPETTSSTSLRVTSIVDTFTPESLTGNHSSLNSQLTVQGEKDYNSATAISGAAVFQGSGTLETLTGFSFLGRVYGEPGSLVKTLRGANVEVNAFSGANIGVAEAIRAKVVATSATIDDLYGINIDLELLNTLPKNSYGLRIIQPSSLDPSGGGLGRALSIQSEFYSTFVKGIGIGSQFTTANPEADIHISGSEPRFLLEASGVDFDIKNLGFFGVEIYSSNPFGTFFPATVFTFDCGINITGGRLLEFRNGGTAVAYIDSDGNYVKI